MSHARDRRRLMVWERYRRRSLLLGADHLNARHQLVAHAHHRVFVRVDRSMTRRHGWPWVLEVGPP